MLKKASKRLMSAIIALVVSIILCVGVCLAWFAVNNQVDGNGMNSQFRGDDLISFTVTPYYLDKPNKEATDYNIASNGNIGVIVDNDNNGVIDDGDAMRPFSLGELYTTAVLLKFDYVIDEASTKTFRIFAECPCPLPETIPETKAPQDAITRLAVVNDGADAFKSNLSNAATFAKATATVDADGKPTVCSEEKGSDGKAIYTPFVNNGHEKSFKLPFYDGIDRTKLTANQTTGNLEGTSYVIMDYDSDRFAYLSALMLESGGSLSSKLNLLGDITFVMEEYDPENPETVEIQDFALDTLAPSAVYTQAAGADIISNTWQFVVTYTDGSKEIVKTNVNHGGDLTIDPNTLNTQTVGEYSGEANGAKVTYSGKVCYVDYKITEAAEMPTVSVTGVSLNKTSTTITVDGTETLSATVAPSNATNRNVTWSSDNTAVATVANGKVTAVAAGTAKITVTTADGGFTAQCTVTVKEAVAVTGVELDKSELSLTVGDTYTLTATVKPSDAANKNITWKSGKTSVATVDKNGKVTAVAAGTAKITVTTADGSFTAQCTVTVKEATVAVTGVELDKSELSLTVGDTYTLTATVKPSGATDKTVTWESGKTSVATVENGVVTAVAAGTATITVTTNDGNKTAQCTVTVKEATVSVTGVSLNKTSTTLTVGGTETLTANIEPENATDKTVTWKSSAESVATVDNGVVTAVAAGTATITVTTNDGNKTATCTVTVENAGGGGTTDLTLTHSNNVWSTSENNSKVTVALEGAASNISGTVDGISYTVGLKFESSAGKLTLNNTDTVAKTVRVYVKGKSGNSIDITSGGKTETKDVTVYNETNEQCYIDLTIEAGTTVEISKGSGSTVLLAIKIT